MIPAIPQVPQPVDLDEKLWSLHAQYAEGSLDAVGKIELDARCAIGEMANCSDEQPRWSAEPEPVPVSALSGDHRLSQGEGE